MNDLRLLVKNARIDLDVGVEGLYHFRPHQGEPDIESAVIRLYPHGGGPHCVKILDQREDSVFISRGVANIRTAEKRARNLLDQNKVEQAKTEARENWAAYLSLPASVWLGHDEAKYTYGQPVLVFRDPEGEKTNGLVTSVVFDENVSSHFSTRQERYSWLDMAMCRDRDEQDICHLLFLTVTSENAFIGIYHREIDGQKLVATDYYLDDERRVIRREGQIANEEWLEGASREPRPEAITSLEKENEVSGETVRVESPDVDPAQPEEDVGLLKEIGFTNGDLEKLNAAGISNVEDLLDWITQDIEELVSETGISKTKLTRAARKIRKRRG